MKNTTSQSRLESYAELMRQVIQSLPFDADPDKLAKLVSTAVGVERELRNHAKEATASQPAQPKIVPFPPMPGN